MKNIFIKKKSISSKVDVGESIGLYPRFPEKLYQDTEQKVDIGVSIKLPDGVFGLLSSEDNFFEVTNFYVKPHASLEYLHITCRVTNGYTLNTNTRLASLHLVEFSNIGNFNINLIEVPTQKINKLDNRKLGFVLGEKTTIEKYIRKNSGSNVDANYLSNYLSINLRVGDGDIYEYTETVNNYFIRGLCVVDSSGTILNKVPVIY